MKPIIYALSGATMFGSAVIVLFFYRFWKRTRDRLFSWFALAFVMLVIERILLLTVPLSNDFRPYVYLVRMLAFALIAAAVWDKNRQTASSGPPGNHPEAGRSTLSPK